MAPSDNNKGGAIWLVVVLGLVLVTVILVGALILGPDRSSESRGALRLERPMLPLQPKLPNPSGMRRQVV